MNWPWWGRGKVAMPAAAGTQEGIFRFNNMPPGTYTLTAKMRGFKTHTQRDINLASADTRDVGTIKLSLGSMSEAMSRSSFASKA